MAVAAAAVLASLAVPVAAWCTAEALVPVLGVLAGCGGAWLQAVHPPATAHGHDPVLVALLVV